MMIKDYFHFYVGCQYQWQDGDGEWRKSQPLTAYQLSDVYRYHINARLILRPLSDMTEEEAIAVCKFVVVEKRQKQIDIQELTINHIWYIDGEMWHGDGVSEVYDKYIKFNELSADQFRYMLSKGFDLFGLIDAGLAIDKTKL